MTNKALILTLIAIVAIIFMVWYLFVKKSPSYSGWSDFKRDYKLATGGGDATNPCVNYSPCVLGRVRCAALDCRCATISDCNHQTDLQETERQVNIAGGGGYTINNRLLRVGR